MSQYFTSHYAPMLWDRVYSVVIPEYVNQDSDYLNRWGHHITGDKKVDNILKGRKKTIMISVIKMAQYQSEGIPIALTNREDMIEIHKNIEGYLAEWKEHLQYSLNPGANTPKDLLLALEKLSKIIYEKASIIEVNSSIIERMSFGLKSTMDVVQDQERIKQMDKTDYVGISELFKKKEQISRY